MYPLPKYKTAWTNDKQRPPMTFKDTSVNRQRHTVCRTEDDQDLSWRTRRRRRVLSEKVLSKSVTYCPKLSNGSNLYLYNIGRIYSTKNLQSINQGKYATTLAKEYRKGNYSKKEITKYWNYIHSPRQIHQGTGKSSFSTTRKTKKSKKKKKKEEKEATASENSNDEGGDEEDERHDNGDLKEGVKHERHDNGDLVKDEGDRPKEEPVSKPNGLIKEIIELDRRDRREAGDASSTITTSSYRPREGSNSSRSSSSSRSTVSSVSTPQSTQDGNIKDEAPRKNPVKKPANKQTSQRQKSKVAEKVEKDRGHIIVKPCRRENSDDDYDSDSSTGKSYHLRNTDSKTQPSKMGIRRHKINQEVSESKLQDQAPISKNDNKVVEDNTQKEKESKEMTSQTSLASSSSRTESKPRDGQNPEYLMESGSQVNEIRTKSNLKMQKMPSDNEPSAASNDSPAINGLNKDVSQKNGSSEDSSSTRTTDSGTRNNGSSDDNLSTRTTDSGTRNNKESDVKQNDSAKGERPSSGKPAEKSKPKSGKRPDSETSSAKSASSTTLSRSKSKSSLLSRKSNTSSGSSYSQSKTTKGLSNRKEGSTVSKSSSLKTPPRSGKSSAKSVSSAASSKESKDSPEAATNISYRSVSVDSHLAKRMEDGEPLQINDVDKIEY